MTASVAPLAPAFHEGVRTQLRARAAINHLDGLLLLAPGNVRYATGWHVPVNERPVGLWLPTDCDALLLVPRLEAESAEDVPGTGVTCYEEYPGEVPPVLWMIDRIGARALAVDTLDAALLDDARTRVERLALEDFVALHRAVKRPPELALVREAARFADLVLEEILVRGAALLADGGTEADMLASFVTSGRERLEANHGETFRGTKMGITGSVHSGPRGALPHGSVTDRRPEPGDPIVVGIGCSLGGYHAESGATFVVGEISDDQADIMDAMDRARSATRDALAEGLTCAEVNDAALAVLREAGLGDAIRHRIGHGMGVEGHEAPWLAPGDATTPTPGMVFSCEPGVYRPGIDGWRTIDTLVVGSGEVEVASRFQRRHPPESRVLRL